MCRVCQERGAFQEMKEDVLLHVSHIFNPLNLFHLFLAEASVSHSDDTNILTSSGIFVFHLFELDAQLLFLFLLHYVLFILQLHYDHQVLLDYLISKDTGISCAEYILRYVFSLL